MRKKAYVISLGCPKNRVDTEKVLALLRLQGVDLTADLEDADLVLVNTCGFISEARQEGGEILSDLKGWRKASRGRRVVVMGCWPKYAREAGEPLPKWVDAAVASHRPFDVVRACCPRVYTSCATLGQKRIERLLTTPPSYAYLSVAEGCDRLCTYCVIPRIRGKLKSVPPGRILREARALLRAGVRELVLVAQDVASYGRDLAGPTLESLLKDLCQIEADPFWVRMLYCHPDSLSEEVIDLFHEESPLVRYIDIPLQHASPKILRAMGRPRDLSRFQALLKRMADVPGMSIRTTVMVGFPGETDEDFDRLKEFLASNPIQHIGIFCYSDEPLAASHRLPLPVPQDVAQARAEILRNLAAQKAEARHKKRVGGQVQVLVDAQVQGSLYECRSQSEAPEIDPIILLRTRSKQVRPGQFLQARITSGHPDFLEATVAQAFQPVSSSSQAER